MIGRQLAGHLEKIAGFYPVVTVMGPRQSGKTTLVKALFPNHEYRNLEADDVLAIAKDDPRAFLGHGRKPMIIDEVQRFPSLLTYIQEMADEHRSKGQFVLTGSHQPELGAAVSESLAGRTGIATLLPLSVGELSSAGFPRMERDEYLWKGFLPRGYDDGIDPPMLYRDYFQTYVQRDVRKLINVQDLDAFNVFVRLLAGRIGQLLNKESLARDAGISVPTVGKWLSVLEASFIIYRLRPYHDNFGKRQMKSPKVYFTETGLVAYLLGIREPSQIFSHPLVGNLFENMVVSEALKNRLNRGLDSDMWFYRDSSGSVEVDLLIEDGGRLYPREIKSSSTYSGRMRSGLERFIGLGVTAADPKVVYSGKTFDGVAVNFADTDLWCI